MHNTIIEKDIDFYKACLENATNNLRRCVPIKEAYYKKEIEILEQIIEKMQLYFEVFVFDTTRTQEIKG